MKLDSIVYDYNSLQTAITEELNNESPSFQAMYPSDTATSLVNVLSSYGAMLQYQLVSAMANMYTDSAYSETGIRQLAETLGNNLHGNISAQVYCNIERLNLRNINSIIIPAGSKFTVGDLNLYNPDDVVFSINSNTVNNVKLIQGELQSAEFISSGISGEKIYFCEDFKCNTNLVKVFVNNEEWFTSDTFLPYVVSDDSTDNETKVVILRTDGDGRTYIKFGNNSNGRIPAKGTPIRIQFITNEGAEGNINNTDFQIKLTTPIYYNDSTRKRVQLLIDITATTTISGGFNTQSIDVLKESSPYVFASGDRAVRREDYKAMLLNKCGYLTTNVWGEYEEAIINGGYDKIMMNMVYYSGIKSLQQYDRYPITSGIELDPTQVMSLEYDAFESFDGSIASANGFLGSYQIEIQSYDIDGGEISLNYADAYGTGILTCDPSTNSALINKSSNPQYIEEEVFPLNDLSSFDGSGDKIWINQNEDGEGTRAIDLLTGDFKTSTGKYKTSGFTSISYDHPFQILFDLKEGSEDSITAFAFKTPSTSEDFKTFPYKIAIYGTRDANARNLLDNVKNNSKWTKLTGIQSFSNSQMLPNTYTDWVTTNVYNPGNKESYEQTITVPAGDYPGTTESSWGYAEGETHLKLTNPDLYASKDLEYTIKIGGVTLIKNEYDINKTMNEIVIHRELTENEVNQTVIYGVAVDWAKYRFYLIEVYSVQDSANTVSSAKVSLQQIKALYRKSSSYINYDTNYVYLNLPITKRDESDNQREYMLPKSMQFYEYFITTDGINSNNGYVNNDILTYTTKTNSSFDLTFTVNVISISTGLVKVTVSSNSGEFTNSENLRGKIPLLIENAPLVGSSTGTGATITITSESTLNLYANYTGNYYTNTDIQAADLPIINKYNHFTTYLEFKQPHLKNINIEVDVEYDDITNYQVTKNNVINAINDLFKIQPYSMGAKCNVSNIWKAINSVEGIKRFNVLTPKNNIDCLPYEIFNLSPENLIINDIFNDGFK